LSPEYLLYFCFYFGTFRNGIGVHFFKKNLTLRGKNNIISGEVDLGLGYCTSAIGFVWVDAAVCAVFTSVEGWGVNGTDHRDKSTR
jgi:hypothetical protein